MTEWQYKLDFSSIYAKYDRDESAAKAGVAVAKKLRAFVKRNKFESSSYLLRIAKRFEKVKNKAAFNRLMVDLYDFADEWRIWIKT